MSSSIIFSSPGQPWGQFSPFAITPFTFPDGRIYYTAEHYFQANKFSSRAISDQILAQKNPADAIELSRNPEFKKYIRRDWDKIRDDVMYDAQLAKFQAYPNLADLLLSTGDMNLQYRNHTDSYWGDGGRTGKGKNKLGIILMEIRNHFRELYGSEKYAVSTAMGYKVDESGNAIPTSERVKKLKGGVIPILTPRRTESKKSSSRKTSSRRTSKVASVPKSKKVSKPKVKYIYKKQQTQRRRG